MDFKKNGLPLGSHLAFPGKFCRNIGRVNKFALLSIWPTEISTSFSVLRGASRRAPNKLPNGQKSPNRMASIFPLSSLGGPWLGGLLVLLPGAPVKRPRARAKLAGYLLAFHATTHAAPASSSSGGKCGRSPRVTIGSDMLSMLKRKREEVSIANTTP
jgi:hypothetical protein